MNIEFEQPDEAFDLFFAEEEQERGPYILQTNATTYDFFSYMPEHRYIFGPTGDLWPAASVNACLKPMPAGGSKPLVDENGKVNSIKASLWLDQNKAVEQMTWAPGEPQIVSGRMVTDGGWIERDGHNVFNLYRPPLIKLGDPAQAKPWLDHVRKVYPNDDDAERFIRFCAHRRQKPQEKINHALVLGGDPGIGKDTALAPVREAVGHWNFGDISPKALVGRFNGFLKSVILRVNEGRDQGEISRYDFYDSMKTYTASPPEVLYIDEKNIREYKIFNLCAVIITTNYKTNGIYLPPDDRRHDVMWSPLRASDFEEGYWPKLWGYYEAGGYGYVAAYLDAYDLSGWDAKAPPPKTPAFWEIVDANRAPQEGELADALDKLKWPNAVALSQVIDEADPELASWLREPKNRRIIPSKFEAVDYAPVRNDSAKDGLWKIYDKRQAIYAKAELTLGERKAAAQALVKEQPEPNL